MSAAGASHAPALLPPLSRVAIPLPVEAIVVDHTLFQKWTKAGYDVVWIVPAGTPMLERSAQQSVFQQTSPRMPPPVDLSLSQPQPGPPYDFPRPAPTGRGFPMQSSADPLGDKESEGSPYRQPSVVSRAQSAGPRARWLASPSSPRPRSAPPLPAFPLLDLVLPPATLSPTSSTALPTPRQPWTETPLLAVSPAESSSPVPSMLATLTPAPLSSSSSSVNEMSDTNQLIDEESATMDFKKHIVKEPQHHEPEPQFVEPQSQESASDTPVEQPVCYVNEPSDDDDDDEEEEEEEPVKSKNEGKKPLYLATDADEPYVSDTSDSLFFAPASPPATAQLASIEIETGDERWQEYIADDWERAMPAVADPPVREATEPSPRASTGYSLPGASLSNAVHAMPRPYDLTNARAGATLEDLLNDGATTEADDDDNDDGDGANESDPGSDVHVEADWVRLWHQKPVSEWSEQETQFFRNVMGASAVRAQEDRDKQLKKAEELRQRMEDIKELRRSRLRQLSGLNAVGGEGETRGEEGAKEAGEGAEAVMLTRMQKRALKKREAAKRRRAERKREAGEEAKRKAALAAAAVAIVTVTTAAVAKKISIASKSKEVTQEESATQQKPAPVTQRAGWRKGTKNRPAQSKENLSDKIEVQATQETTATETPAEQARGGENSSGSQTPENVAKPTKRTSRLIPTAPCHANIMRKLMQGGAAKVNAETGIVDQPGRNNVKPEYVGALIRGPATTTRIRAIGRKATTLVSDSEALHYKA